MRADQPAAGPRALPGHADRRPGRGDLAARRRPGQPRRPDRRAGPRRPRPRRHDPGADPGDRHPGRRRRGDRSAHRRRRRRGRGGGQLRRPVGQAGRRDVRGDRAAALGRALLRGDRADRRGAPGPARAARPGRLHLYQGRGGRPGRRRLRARGQALGRARPAALPVRVPAAGGGLGPLRDPDGQRDHPDPGAGRDRDQDVLQRPGELHPGQPVHPGRGAGAAELLRRRRVQLRRHRLRRGRRAGPGRVDRRRRAEPGPVRGRHPALRRLQRQQPVAARPGQRGPGPALRGAVAEPRADQRPAVPPFPGLSPARAGRRLLRQQDGLGAGQLLRPAGRPPGHRVRLGPAELAALVLGRAAGRPHRRRRVRPDQLLQVPGHRPGRRAGPAVAVHRRRRRRARPDRLHRPAQRARHLRGRHHRHPAEGRRVPAGQQRRQHRTRQGPHPGPDPRRRARVAGRRHLRLRRLRRHGPEVAGPAVPAVPQRPRRRGLPVRRQPRDRPGLRDRPRHPDHLRRRARLGAVRPAGLRRRRLRGPDDGRRRSRPGQRRLLRDRVAAAGKGLPRLRPRADPGLQPGGGRAAVRLQAQDRHPVPGPRGGREGPRRGSPPPPGLARPGRAPKPGRHDLGR